jgi:copper transport protein
LVVVVLAVAGSLVAASPAGAHAFLVSTSPSQGERLTTAPDAVVLQFSERPDPATAVLRLETSEGVQIDLPPLDVPAGGVAMQVPIPAGLEDGIYVVAWQGFSVVDGHGTFGEFSFAVGDIAGVVPAPVASSTAGPWATAASWAFYVGLGLAAGSLALALLDPQDRTAGRRRVQVGLVVALLGAGGAWALQGGAAGSGAALSAALAVALLAMAAWVHVASHRPGPTLAVLVAGAGAWSARSHAASFEGVVGGIVDAVHLVAGVTWAGALAVVVTRLWRARRQGRPLPPVLARYARLALVLVVVLAAAGTVSALLLVSTWGELWSTTYGQLVVAKVALFTGAVTLAGVSRWSMARRRRGALERATTVEVAVLAVVLVVAGVLSNHPPPPPAIAAEALLGPPPLEDPITRDAGLAGQLNVEVSGDGSRLDVRVFSPSGPVPGTEVELSLRQPDGTTADALPRPCGPGCFTQELALAEGPTTVIVEASAPGWTGGRYEAGLVWPPGAPAGDRLREVIAITRAIPHLTVAETVSSGPGSVVSEQIFELSGDRFVDAEPYAAGNVEDVRTLPGAPERLSLYVPGSRIYAELTLDEQGRMVESRLVSPGHDIRRRFDYPTS